MKQNYANKGFDFFSPFYFFLAYYILFSPFKILMAYLGLTYQDISFYSAHLSATALLFGQFITVLLSYLLFRKVRFMRAYNIINGYFGIKEESLIFDKYFNLKGLLLIILFVIGYELYLQIIGFSLLHVGQLSAVEVKISRGDSVFASVFLQKILHQIILFLSYILIFRALVAQKSRLLLFFLFCILLFISIATGSRGVFITSFLLPMIFIYNAYIKKISIIKFFLVAYLIFVFLVSTHLLRHMDGFSFDDVVSSVYDATEVPKYVGLFLKRVDSFFPYFYKYWEAMSDDKLEFHYGMTYIESVLQFFPRQILSDKPDSFVRNINNELHLQSSGGGGLAPIAEAWSNFGPFGVLIYSVLSGLIMAMLQKFYIYSKNDKNLFVLIFIYTLGFQVWHKITISPGVTHNLPEFVVALIYYFVIFKIIRGFLHYDLNIFLKKLIIISK